jgi:hypothetical protein
VELGDREGRREHVLLHAVAFLLEVAGLLKALLFDDVFILTVAGVVEFVFVHPTEAADKGLLSVLAVVTIPAGGEEPELVVGDVVVGLVVS